jgi:hypothetical protein
MRFRNRARESFRAVERSRRFYDNGTLSAIEFTRNRTDSISYHKTGRPVQAPTISMGLQQSVRAELEEMASVLEPKIPNDAFECI